jgi:hypothetical protein
MKKSLVIALVMAFVLSIACTAFAAAGSFSDVPAKHWAYDAVNKLAKAGLIEGDNGRFLGDQPMTRYEFAVVIAKMLNNYDKADAATKTLIDKLSAEFTTELNTLGVRVKTLEGKTNTWVGGQTRFRYLADSPNAPNTKKLTGANQFDFRQRVFVYSNINDHFSAKARLSVTGKESGAFTSGGNGNSVGCDLLAITGKDVLGLDQIRVGRNPFDEFSYLLFSKAPGVDGARIDKQMGDVLFTGSVNNVVDTTPAGYTAPVGKAYTLTTGQFNYNVAKGTNLLAGYYWADIPGTSTATGSGTLLANAGHSFDSSQGWLIGVRKQLGGLVLMGDYVGTSLANPVNLSKNPTGWAVQLTNAQNNPQVGYPAGYIVDWKKPGTSAWAVSYRSIDSGAIPYGVRAFDQTAITESTDQYSMTNLASDNAKAWYLIYQNVLEKGLIMTLEYQNMKVKNLNVTGLTDSKLGQTYMVKFEFYY